MAEESFVCDDCGQEFPVRKMKEYFDETGDRLELCPEDLDDRMNEQESVRGGPGKEKAAASYSEDAPQDAPYGERTPPESEHGLSGGRPTPDNARPSVK